MIEFNVFPGGKKRVVTFSYDDGHANDERLVNLFNQYGVKGTFHVHGTLEDGKDMTMLQKRYQGHEISCHTARHGWGVRMPYQSVVEETLSNRSFLEKVAEYPVIGMSYPYGSYNEAVIEAMRACGIVYARTTKSTMKFWMPESFMEWHPTCHHNDAQELTEKFVENSTLYRGGPLLYIWGHSYEFRTEEDWGMMERLLNKLAEVDDIWYATNFEIYQYVNAQKALIISADECCFYNPTSISVWIQKNKKEIICVPAGERIGLN